MLRCLPVLALACVSCATIVSESEWPVTIDSDPPGAMITVWDEAGDVVHTGPAPATVTLSSSDGFFSKADYDVEARMAGYEPVREELRAKLNPWYFGNILFGGLIGILIVDPATGAMWKLKDGLVVQLGGAPPAAPGAPAP